MNSASRSERTRRITKPHTKKQKMKTKHSIIPMLVLFAAILALLVIVSPKEPVSRAIATVGTEDGHVPVAAPSNRYEGLVISEIMAANRAAVPDETGVFGDYIELWNKTDTAMPLHNVGLSDDGTSIRFIFPNILLNPDGRIVVFASDTNQADPAKPFHAKFKISSIGETIYLFDPSAYTIDQVTTPIMNADSAYALMADGTFALTNYYSPGYENSEAGFMAYRNESRINDGALVISEIMANAKSNLLLDEDGETSDWMEFLNLSDQPMPLKDIFLSNKENKPLKWKFPEDAVIEPHGYYVVFCSGKDRPPNDRGIAHTNFRISAERDIMLLSDSHGRLLDRIAIDNLPADKTYGRNEQNNWQVFNIGTPGLSNTTAGAAIVEQQWRALNPIGVYITEVMASNDSIVVLQSAASADWVELHNFSNEMAYLEGYALSDDANRARKWQFPAGATISPNNYITVFLDGKPELTTSGQYHTNFKLLRTGGETICFSTPDGLVLDKIDLSLIPTNVSYGRTEGLAGHYFYDAPTPGQPNGTGFYGYAEEPTFSMRGGLYYEPVTFTIDVPKNTVVYYSTDGSIPTMNHTRYEGEEITTAFTKVFRARAFKEDYQPSEIATQSYFINALHTLPIVSLSIDPDELFSEITGMFTPGPNIDKSQSIPFLNAIYRQHGKLPRPSYVEYYSLDNDVIIHQGMEVSLSGANSLDFPQKSLKFRAKSLYGSKYIDAPLFEDRPFEQYKSFTLRISGNDSAWTRLLDGFQSRLVDDVETNIAHQAWKPVVVYINGVYWGHYNMRERKDRYFIAQHEGVPLEQADSIDISLGNGKPEYGSSKPYNNLIAEAKKLSPGKREEDYRYLADRVDIENIIDFFCFQMFFGNTDLGNVQIYRFHGEGQKFKWLLYDLDYGFYESDINSPRSLFKEGGMGRDNVDNTIIRKLMEHEGFRDQFLTRLGEIFQLFTTDYMIDKLDNLVAIIKPEMRLHFARWAEFTDKAIIAELPNTPEAAYRYWDYRTQTRLKNTLRKRPTILYDYIQEWFKFSSEDMLHYFGERPPIPAGVLP